MEQIHGHDVIRMMLESGKAYTRAELLGEIAAVFGPTARFYTCSEENLTADGLIDFLQAKGKFVTSDPRFRISPERVCQH